VTNFAYVPCDYLLFNDAEHVKKFINDQRQVQKNSPPGISSSSSFDSYMIQGSNAFRWLSISSKCGLEDYAQACIELIVSHQLPVPTEGITTSLQPQHADALVKGLQQAQVQALLLLQEAQEEAKAKQTQADAASKEAALLRVEVARLKPHELEARQKNMEVSSLSDIKSKLIKELDQAVLAVQYLTCAHCKNAVYSLPKKSWHLSACIAATQQQQGTHTWQWQSWHRVGPLHTGSSTNSVRERVDTWGGVHGHNDLKLGLHQ
jgi:uncharacterized protein YfaS (alpha-2-macroglobulin family)